MLVPYGEVELLKSRLEQLLQDPQLRQQLALRARQKAEKEYRSETYQRRILDVIQVVLAKRKAPSHS